MEIYKFLDENGAARFLENWSIAFKLPQNFTDPFDCWPVFLGTPREEREQKAQARAASLMADSDRFSTLEDAMHYAYWEIDHFDKMYIGDMHGYVLSSFYYVTCFTRTDSSLPMWTHYASKEAGIVVELAADTPLLVNRLRPVKYSQKRPRVDVRVAQGSLKGRPDFLFVKSLDWAYEQEERVVISNSEAQEFHNEANVVSENPHLRFAHIGKQHVKSITFGSSFYRKNLGTTINSLMSDPDCQHIELKVARVDREEYRINCVPIPRA
jgi:hypothetical protein